MVPGGYRPLSGSDVREVIDAVALGADRALPGARLVPQPSGARRTDDWWSSVATRAERQRKVPVDWATDSSFAHASGAGAGPLRREMARHDGRTMIRWRGE